MSPTTVTSKRFPRAAELGEKLRTVAGQLVDRAGEQRFECHSPLGLRLAGAEAKPSNGQRRKTGGLTSISSPSVDIEADDSGRYLRSRARRQMTSGNADAPSQDDNRSTPLGKGIAA